MDWPGKRSPASPQVGTGEPASQTTLLEAARPEAGSGAAKSQLLPPAPLPGGSPPYPAASGRRRDSARAPPGPRVGYAEAHAAAGRRGQGVRGSRGCGAQSPVSLAAAQASSIPPAPSCGSARTDRLVAAAPGAQEPCQVPPAALGQPSVPSFPSLGPARPRAPAAKGAAKETVTDHHSPAPVTARGQELWPRFPSACTSAHGQRCSLQKKKKIQNCKRLSPPFRKRESGGNPSALRAGHPTAAVTATRSPDAAPGRERRPRELWTLTARWKPGPRQARPSRLAPRASPRRPPARVGGERREGVEEEEEEVRKEMGVWGREERKG